MRLATARGPLWLVLASVLCLTTAVGRPASADEGYDCLAEANRGEPTTIEIVVSKRRWRGQLDTIERELEADADHVQARIKLLPFLDPPRNIGIGKCVPAEVARLAIREAIKYAGGIDRLIRQDILPHHWVKIGSMDTAELAWMEITQEELAGLTDASLTTEEFHALYRTLASPKEKPLPFGMGSIKQEE